MVTSIPHPSEPAVLVPPSPVGSMFISEVSVSEVWDVVRRLRSTRSTGMDGIFCDLSRAFDCVRHDVLLSKLEAYGIRGVALQLFASYLKDRKQVVEISTNTGIHHSNEGVIKCGVPQGSILGPILFVIYINDLPKNINHSKIIMYADDCTLQTSESTASAAVDAANNSLAQASEWFFKNGLVLNPIKTGFIRFTILKAPNSHIFPGSGLTYNNNSLQHFSATKFLGLHLDAHLNWESHVDVICKRLRPVCYALGRLAQLLRLEGLVEAVLGGFKNRAGALVSSASNDLAALSAGEYPFGRSSAGWRPVKIHAASLGGTLPRPLFIEIAASIRETPPPSSVTAQSEASGPQQSASAKPTQVLGLIDRQHQPDGEYWRNTANLLGKRTVRGFRPPAVGVKAIRGRNFSG
ncbi:uncharacterized protein LOC124356517 [Homalodisca vitripennis]|uniref:uncharacterized protein LOC124356517 n=1 Tax=Homalodisca vitripennis TaxID=197043 RepID=UPI001EEBFC56|nr:uncharacterized protein LOC124356517 [Homalodisca vitripennis]